MLGSSLLRKVKLPTVVKAYLGITTLLSLITLTIKYQSYQSLLRTTPVESVAGVSFSSIAVPMLQLIPGSAMFYPWVLLTSTFVETTLVRYAFALVVLYFGLNYCEKMWNYNDSGMLNQAVFSETVIYVTVVAVLTNLTTAITTTVVDVMFLADQELSAPITHGVLSILMAFIVVVKQFSPEHTIKILQGGLTVRVRQIPIMILFMSVVLSLVRRSLSPMLPICNSFYISWMYLRFFQKTTLSNDLITPTTVTQGTVIRGDASDTFAFIQFFPDFIKPTLKPLCRAIYHTSVLLSVIKPFNDDDIETGNLRAIKRINAFTQQDQNVSARDIAERRRQVALRVLEERVGKDDFPVRSMSSASIPQLPRTNSSVVVSAPASTPALVEAGSDKK
ncbi:unnamed protein product [Kuraishia capsulata CBS 1993]|uniref:Transmembrane protein 115 n=1 Tax=Kuraishia capsulata CBS 1993 TaxID=1382522 RepID=W6MHY6_9ASCO|nr:uncharacterized protein KUCA_T00001413001 [Kuraishia capsulata CBS 1993]CDK25443.1 unnamed protein product [Kuraishia capsulata CBS 1993]